jgi:murein L,D-transpeptidase YcbB/YkuD
MKTMKSSSIAKGVTAIAIVALAAGCSSWHRMDKTEGTVMGATGGAVAGAVVGGPVGAVVGGVGGAYVGNEVAGKDRAATSSSSPSATTYRYDPGLVRDVQQALNERGYNAGAVDGQWGPATEEAVRRFQQASGLPQTGELERSTLAALGVSTASM